MNKRYKSYKFWLAILGGVLIIVQNIFKANGVVITDEIGYNILNAICGVLVFLGVIDKPKENGNGTSNNNLGENNMGKNNANKNITDKNNTNKNNGDKNSNNKKNIKNVKTSPNKGKSENK